MRILSIIVTLLLLTASAYADEKCKQSLSFENAPLKSCLTKKSAGDVDLCFKKNIPGLESTRSAEASVLLRLSKPVCVFGSVVHPGPSGLNLGVSIAGQILYVSDFRTPATVGIVTYSGYSACGWVANGKGHLPLIDKFSFIPQNARIKIRSADCKGGIIDPGNSVELDEAANICDATFPKGTKFFYMPDEAYHFVALTNAKMLYADPEIDAQTMDIKKGQDYRNFDPAKAPCMWSKTPADVLKSFQEDTSE